MCRESLWMFLLCFLGNIAGAFGHAYLMDPPSRNLVAANKDDFDCPHCLNTGGTRLVKERAKGRYPSNEVEGSYGVCGDPAQNQVWPDKFSEAQHMKPTKPYRTYIEGQIITIAVVVNTHHYGHYEFSICDEEGGVSGAKGVGNISQRAAQRCFDRRKLKRVDPQKYPEQTGCNKGREWRQGSNDCQPIDPRHPERWYQVPRGNGELYKGHVYFEKFREETGLDGWKGPALDGSLMHYWLPKGLTCRSCTLQWHWVSANQCLPDQSYRQYPFPDSSWCLWCKAPWATIDEAGCGRAGLYGEEFRNCADISIMPNRSDTLPGPPNQNARRRRWGLVNPGGSPAPSQNTNPPPGNFRRRRMWLDGSTVTTTSQAAAPVMRRRRNWLGGGGTDESPPTVTTTSQAIVPGMRRRRMWLGGGGDGSDEIPPSRGGATTSTTSTTSTSSTTSTTTTTSQPAFRRRRAFISEDAPSRNGERRRRFSSGGSFAHLKSAKSNSKPSSLHSASVPLPGPSLTMTAATTTSEGVSATLAKMPKKTQSRRRRRRRTGDTSRRRGRRRRTTPAGGNGRRRQTNGDSLLTERGGSLSNEASQDTEMGKTTEAAEEATTEVKKLSTKIDVASAASSKLQAVVAERKPVQKAVSYTAKKVPARKNGSNEVHRWSFHIVISELKGGSDASLLHEASELLEKALQNWLIGAKGHLSLAGWPQRLDGRPSSWSFPFLMEYESQSKLMKNLYVNSISLACINRDIALCKGGQRKFRGLMDVSTDDFQSLEADLEVLDILPFSIRLGPLPDTLAEEQYDDMLHNLEALIANDCEVIQELLALGGVRAVRGDRGEGAFDMLATVQIGIFAAGARKTIEDCVLHGLVRDTKWILDSLGIARLEADAKREGDRGLQKLEIFKHTNLTIRKKNSEDNDIQSVAQQTMPDIFRRIGTRRHANKLSRGYSAAATTSTTTVMPSVSIGGKTLQNPLDVAKSVARTINEQLKL